MMGNSSSPVRIGMVGITGRMGREIVALAADDPEVVVVGGIAGPRSAVTEVDGVPVVSTLTDLLPQCDVVIDFSSPEASVAVASAAADAEVPIVIGTTGLDAGQMDVLRAAASRTAVYYARNTAHGVNALLGLLPQIAAALSGYDIEIVEMHHRHKKDAPSGTALALGEAVIAGLPDAPSRTVRGRDGLSPRQGGEIGFHSLRGGGNTGEHTIVFASDGEEIRISHRALNRGAFASGAIRAAKALVGREPGWYGPSA
ncbi:MAG: 4-hydroxy-tetrahydrodipicolinate reductase [Thermomicrobiales bacterium]